MAGAKQTLAERQRRVIETWLNNPLDDFKTIAAKAGVSERTFYTYRHDDSFMAAYHEACRLRFNSMESKAMKVLDSHLENGNFQAAKYVLDGMGYKPTEKVEAKVSSDVIINIEE